MSEPTKNNWNKWHHLLHREILNNKDFIPGDTNLLIAVSGGQDSMSLLTLINDIKLNHNWSINVWHGDHGWHEQSEYFASELKKFCDIKKISFYLDTAENDITTEEKARNWRYKKLFERANQISREEKCKKNLYILTGHTSTDNVETFFLNLARGSNYAGLSGIPKKRIFHHNFFLARPILIFNREDTSMICKEMKIPVWEDPTNLDLKIKRNLIRQKVIFHLEKIYPGCTIRVSNFILKMANYNKEKSDLAKLALLSLKVDNKLNRIPFIKLGIEARSTILNNFIKEKYDIQISAQNLDKSSIKILTQNHGELQLKEEIKIIWDKHFIDVIS